MPLLLFTSCQNENDITPVLRSEMSSRDHHISYFQKKKSDGSIANRTTTYSINDGLDLVNDGMNFLYCRPDDLFEQTIVFKDTFNVPVDGFGQIDESDLLTLMDDIADFAGTNYHADMRSDKEPLIFHMRQVFGGGSGYIPIEAAFAMVAGNPTNATDAYPYEDSWIYGQWESDVSEECSTEGANADAADLFRRDLRKQLAYRDKYSSYYFINPYVHCYSGFADDCFSREIPETYFPSNETTDGYEIPNPFDITLYDNLFDYLLFFNSGSGPNFDECLSISEMNFYYESMYDLVLDELPSPPGSLKIAQIEVGYNLLLGGNSTIFHSLQIVSATRVSITDDEYMEAISLPCC